jgi:hypothetical protein
MAKYNFVVMLNAAPGKDAEFNEWYTKQHLPDVLNVSGFVCGQRYRLSATQHGGDTNKPYKYVALYEIETDDIAGVLKDLQSRSGTADMVPSDSIDRKTTTAFVFEPIGEKVMAKDVKRPRRAA